MDKEKKDFYVRGALIAVTLIAVLLMVGFMLSVIQSRQVRRGVEEEMRESIAYVQSVSDTYELRGTAVENWDDRVHEKSLSVIVRTMTEMPELQASEDFLSQMLTITDAHDIMVVDRDKKVLYSAAQTTESLDGEEFAPLFETFETGRMTKVEVMTKVEALEWMQNTLNSENDIEGSYATQDETPVAALYAFAIDDKRACVMVDNGMDRLLSLDVTDPWELLLSNVIIGRKGFVFAFSDETGEVYYYPGYEGINRISDVASLGLDRSKLKDGVFTSAKLEGERHYLFGLLDEESKTWIVCAVPFEEVYEGRRDVTILTWLLFVILAFSVAVYALSLMRRHMSLPGRRPDAPRHHDSKIGPKRRLAVYTAFCLIIFFTGSFFLQMLYLVSGWSNDNSQEADYIEYKVHSGELLYELFESYYTNSEQEVLDLATWYMEHCVDQITTSTLDDLAKLLSYQSLRIYDMDSLVLVADSSYATAPKDFAVGASTENEADMNVGTGAKTTAIVPGDDISASMLSLRDAYRGEDDQIIGYIVADEFALYLDMVKSELNLGGILESVRLGSGGFVFSVDSENKLFSWHPDSNKIGKSVIDYGMTDDELKNNLSTYIVMEGVRYYAVSGQSGNDLIYLVVPRAGLMRGLFGLAVEETLVACIAFLLIGLWVYTIKGTKGRTTGVVERLRTHYQNRTAEELAFSALLGGLVIVCLLVLLGNALFGMQAREDVLGYVLNETWEYGVNEFAVTASAILVLEAGFLLLLIRFVALLIAQILSVRAATAIRMLTSLVTYLIVFSVIYRCLVFFGMDPSALMASAGIVSVVIGIGANSLVGDIIAGIFLLMEGNVQVGDVILIEDFRGRVEEIGIRMTKVYDFDACVFKIVPNKEVQNVVNMSMRSATIVTEFLISYEEDLQRVEKLLVQELEAMEGHITGMEGRPSYRGVEKLDDNGVLLYVWAWGNEEYHHVIKREIYRRIYLMFNANGIEVPYPQVTVHRALSAAPSDDLPSAEGQADDQ